MKEPFYTYEEFKKALIDVMANEDGWGGVEGATQTLERAKKYVRQSYLSEKADWENPSEHSHVTDKTPKEHMLNATLACLWMGMDD